MNGCIGNGKEVEERWFFGIVVGIFDLEEDGGGLGVVPIVICDI